MIKAPSYHTMQDLLGDRRGTTGQLVGDPCTSSLISMHQGDDPVFWIMVLQRGQGVGGQTAPSPESHRCSMYSMTKGSKCSQRLGSQQAFGLKEGQKAVERFLMADSCGRLNR